MTTPDALCAKLDRLARQTRQRLLETPAPKGAPAPAAARSADPLAPWPLIQLFDSLEKIHLQQLPPPHDAGVTARTLRALAQICADQGRRLPPLLQARLPAQPPAPQRPPSGKAPGTPLITAALSQEPRPGPLAGRRLTLKPPSAATARAGLLDALSIAPPAALAQILNGLPLSALIAAAERAEADWPPSPPPAPRTPLAALRLSAARAWGLAPTQPTHLKQLFTTSDAPDRRAADLAFLLENTPPPQRAPLLEALSPALDAATLWAALRRDALQRPLPPDAAARLWRARQRRPLPPEQAALLATATPPQLAAPEAAEMPDSPAKAILLFLHQASQTPPPSPNA